MNTLIKQSWLVGILTGMIFLNACRDSDKNSSLIFEGLNESLERSNKNLDLSTIQLINSLELKKREPAMAERANVWASRAYSVIDNSRKMIALIDSVQMLAIKMGDRKKYYEELDSALKKYQASILTYDLYERKGLDNRINFRLVNLNIDFDTSCIKTFLLKLKNDVRNTENMAVMFCENQVGCLDCGGFEKFQVITASNSSVLKKGQEMIIKAGIGVFSVNSKPSFEINGVNVIPNENGVGEYKMMIKSEPGDYKVHVKIKYKAPDGRHNAYESDIAYEVIK